MQFLEMEMQSAVYTPWTLLCSSSFRGKSDVAGLYSTVRLCLKIETTT